MEPRGRLVNKNDAKKTFVTRASDNHTSQTHLAGVYNPICSHKL